ncbi:hypothetical protein B0H19DRAFT_1381100 [Mycena capillaripes]|nr:hypothetical protein B0H19DRAFT_1381100 [Mycena capillaripes]
MYSFDPVLAFSLARPALALKPMFRPEVMDVDVDVLIPRKRAHDDILAQSQSVKKMRLTPVFGLKNRVLHSSLVYLRRPRFFRPRRFKVPAPAVDVPLTVVPVTVVITEIVVDLKPALTKTEKKELERWNALCDKRRSDFSAHAPRPGPWNARCNDGHLSPHATAPSTDELKATASAGPSTVVPTVVPAVPNLANYTLAVPKSEMARGKQRAVDPIAVVFDIGASSTPIGENTNARTSTAAFSGVSFIVDPNAIPAVIPTVLHTSVATSALAVPKSGKAAGKQRAVDPMAASDNGTSSTPIGEITNARTSTAVFSGGSSIVDPTAIPAVIPAVFHTSVATSALAVPKSEKAQGKQRAVDPIAVIFDIGATRVALADLTNGPLTRSSNGGGGSGVQRAHKSGSRQTVMRSSMVTIIERQTHILYSGLGLLHHLPPFYCTPDATPPLPQTRPRRREALPPSPHCLFVKRPFESILTLRSAGPREPSPPSHSPSLTLSFPLPASLFPTPPPASALLSFRGMPRHLYLCFYLFAYRPPTSHVSLAEQFLAPTPSRFYPYHRCALAFCCFTYIAFVLLLSYLFTAFVLVLALALVLLFVPAPTSHPSLEQWSSSLLRQVFDRQFIIINHFQLFPQIYCITSVIIPGVSLDCAAYAAKLWTPCFLQCPASSTFKMALTLSCKTRLTIPPTPSPSTPTRAIANTATALKHGATKLQFDAENLVSWWGFEIQVEISEAHAVLLRILANSPAVLVQF